MRRRVRRRRVDATLEPARCLRRELVPPRRTGQGHRVEVRSLDHHVPRRGGQLVGSAAHHPGQADRTGAIRDQQVVDVERSHDVVQGGQLLAFGGLADENRSVERVLVVGVDRLAGLQHDVVGDVDGQRDGPHPGQLNPAGQPAGAGPGRVDPGHGQCHEQRAGLRQELDRIPVRHLQWHRPVDRVAELDRSGLRRLAGQTADGQAVAPISSHGDVQHVLPQAQHRGGIAAGGQVRLAQHQDPGVVVPEAELAGRADHPVGDVAVGRAGGDRELAWQHRTRQGDHDQIADGEVARPADDAARPRLRRCAHRRRPGTSGSSCRSSAARRRTPAPGPRPAGR